MNQNKIDQDKLCEKYILDPLSVIIKLAILSKKQVGSKITIDSNTIFIQEVGVFQGFVRFVYKINKDEIQYLYNPIELASLKYLTVAYLKTYPTMKMLFKNAIKGIEKLIETYKQNIVFTHALFMYKTLIYNHLHENPFLFISDSISSEYTNTIIDNFSTVWTEERINIVLNLIDFINKDTEYDRSIKCLEDFMIIIDKEIQFKTTLVTKSDIVTNKLDVVTKSDVVTNKTKKLHCNFSQFD